MNPQIVIKENWLTRPASDLAYFSTLIMGILLGLIGYWYLADTWGIAPSMVASYQKVIGDGEYWRLWTALMVHADTAHLLSNLSLFLPLAFMLTGHFGVWVFPTLGIALGGLINLIVIQTMPPETGLIGISGVVYWMGAVWTTLFLFIDRRKSLRRRIALAMFLSVVLFIPETYKPEISYLSHFVGYVLGVFSGWIIYLLFRHKIDTAEIKELVFEIDDVDLGVIDSSPDDVRPPKSVI